MKYETVGQIKSVDLANHTFTLEPISACRFKPKEESESYKIMFRDTSRAAADLEEVNLVKSDVLFKYSSELSGAILILKQNRTKIQVSVDDLKLRICDTITATELSHSGDVINDGKTVQIITTFPMD